MMSHTDKNYYRQFLKQTLGYVPSMYSQPRARDRNSIEEARRRRAMGEPLPRPPQVTLPDDKVSICPPLPPLRKESAQGGHLRPPPVPAHASLTPTMSQSRPQYYSGVHQPNLPSSQRFPQSGHPRFPHPIRQDLSLIHI